MQTVYVGIIAVVAGILAGAAGNQLMQPEMPRQADDRHAASLLAILDGIDSVQRSLNAMQADIAALQLANYGTQPDSGYAQTTRYTENAEVVQSAECAGANNVAERDMAVEDAMLQTVMVRLNDPAYIASTTLSGIMHSEEMRTLSNESREKVVSDLVGRMNRGEIDAERFFRGIENP